MPDKKFCVTCGNIDVPKNKTTGSFIGELALWIIFVLLASFASGWLLLIPLIYTIIRAVSGKQACSKCMSDHIIPLDSPIAIAKMTELGIVDSKLDQ